MHCDRFEGGVEYFERIVYDDEIAKEGRLYRFWKFSVLHHLTSPSAKSSDILSFYHRSPFASHSSRYHPPHLQTHPNYQISQIALRKIQERARATSTVVVGQIIEELRVEHERIKKERSRAVSSVLYSDVGVTRYDGTRIRANSEESERIGLLGDVASFSNSNYYRRDRSVSSVLSIDTLNSDLLSLDFTRARLNSRSNSPLRRISTYDSVSVNNGRVGSSLEIIEYDDTLPYSPPSYKNISLDTLSVILVSLNP